MFPVDERPGELGRKWHLQPFQQWSEWLTRGWNWRNFTLVHVEVEFADYKGRSLELTLALCGFGVIIETYRAESRAEALGPVNRMMAAVQRGEVVATTLEELNARERENETP
jgi:hypothetical protein